MGTAAGAVAAISSAHAGASRRCPAAASPCSTATSIPTTCCLAADASSYSTKSSTRARCRAVSAQGPAVPLLRRPELALAAGCLCCCCSCGWSGCCAAVAACWAPADEVKVKSCRCLCGCQKAGRSKIPPAVRPCAGMPVDDDAQHTPGHSCAASMLPAPSSCITCCCLTCCKCSCASAALEGSLAA